MRNHSAVRCAEETTGSFAIRGESAYQEQTNSLQQSPSYHAPRRLRLLTGILLILISLLYLGSVTSRWHPTPDSALYQMLGQNLASGFGHTLWGTSFTQVPPGYPGLIALLNYWGLGSHFWQNLCMAFLALAALVSSWRSLRYWTSSGKALLLLGMLAGSFNMHHNSIRLLTDVPCMAIFWAGVWLCQRARSGSRFQFCLGILCLAGTCFMRVPGVFLVIGTVLGLYWEHRLQTGRMLSIKKSVLRILLSVGAIGSLVSGGLLFSFLTRQPFQASFVFRPLIHAWQSGEELSLSFMGQSLPLAVGWGLFGIPCVVGAVLAWRRQQRLGISILTCYLLGIWLMRPLLARYFLPVMPILFWLYLEGMLRLLTHFIAQWQTFFGKQSFYRWRLTPVQTTFLFAAILLGINLPKTLRSVYRVHHAHELPGYEEHQALVEVTDFLRQRAEPGDRFMSNTDQRLLGYLSKMDSISISDRHYKGRSITPADIALWREQGTNYFIAGYINSNDHLRRSEAAFWQASIDSISTELPFVCVFSNHNYRVYTATPRRHAETLLQTQLQSAAMLLREVAQPTDRFVASQNQEQLAYLSGVRDCSHETPDIDLEVDSKHLQDQGATLFVLFRDSSSEEYWKQIRTLRKQPGLYYAHATSNFALFSTRIEVALQLEPDVELRALTKFLREHRQSEDRLAGNDSLGRLTELSQIPGISSSALPRVDDTQFELTDKVLQQWLEQGANWIVIRLGKGRTTHFWSSVGTARGNKQLHEIPWEGYCKVFCTRPIQLPEHIAKEPKPTVMK